MSMQKQPPRHSRTQGSSRQDNKRFWDFVSAGENQPAELILYGDIASESWWGDEVTPRQFSDDLQALGSVSEIVVRINSGGGDVFAAFAIYSRLKDHPAHITVKVDGWAGSAATIIAMAGDTVKIPAAANFMVHNPSMGVLGYYQAQDFRSFADECDTIKDSIVNAYALKTGKDKSEIAAIMSASTWYTGETAVQNGFCDELMFEEIQTEATNTHKIIVNSVEMDLAKLKNVPQSVLNSRPHGGGDCLNHTTQTEQGAGTPKNQKESEETMPEIKTVDELKAAYPTLTQTIADAAAAAAQDAERKRIQDIEGVAIAGYEDIIKAAKFDKPVSAADIALAIVNRQKEQGGKHLKDRAADVTDSGVNDVGAEGQEGAAGSGPDPFAEAIDRLFPQTR